MRFVCIRSNNCWPGLRARDDVEARVVCGDSNATLEMPSAQLMARVFRPTQTPPRPLRRCRTRMAASPIPMASV